jgi:hypothetical protein
VIAIVAGMEGKRKKSTYKTLIGNWNAKKVDNLQVHGRVILKWILKNRICEYGQNSSGSELAGYSGPVMTLLVS